MEDILIPIVAIGVPLLGLPWLILHYVTRWKTNASLSVEDENLLDDLYSLARRLDDRMTTIERILAADNPNWNGLGYDRPTAEAPTRPLLEKPTDHEDIDSLERRLEQRLAAAERSPAGRA